MARTVPKICQARLPDLSTPCVQTTKGASPYCPEHGKEYAKRTQEYKNLSADTQRLDPGQLSASDIAEMGRTEVVWAITIFQAYRDALDEEIRARATHHARFFESGAHTFVSRASGSSLMTTQTVDTGHQHWLALLRKKHRRTLSQLQGLDNHLAKFKARSWSDLNESAVLPLPLPRLPIGRPGPARSAASAPKPTIVSMELVSYRRSLISLLSHLLQIVCIVALSLLLWALSTLR